MRGVIWKTWWPLLDPLFPDSFARLHWCISLFPAAGSGIHHPAGCRAPEPGGLDYGALVAVAALHCPEAEDFYRYLVKTSPASRERLLPPSPLPLEFPNLLV